MPTQILLSPGRIVEGNVYKSSNIGLNGQIKAKPEFYFAVAIAKNDPRLGEIFNHYLHEAHVSYGNNKAISERIGPQINLASQFAWKIADGDIPERREKPGQAGCWIFKIKTTWDVKVVDAQNIPIDPNLLRTGYYCDVMVNLKGNNKYDHTAGLFVNPVFVRWLFPGYGDQIIVGPQPSVMGAAPAQLPPGAAPQQQSGQASPQHQPGPGGMGSHVPGMGGGAPAPQATYSPPVGYQNAPAATHGAYQAQPQAPHAGQASPQGWGGQPGGVTHPTPSAPAMTSGATPGYASTAAGPTPAPMHHATGMPTAYPSENPTYGPASGPAAQAPALPAGAHYTQAQPGSPTAYPSSNPVHGFAHGNPQPGV